MGVRLFSDLYKIYYHHIRINTKSIISIPDRYTGNIILYRSTDVIDTISCRVDNYIFSKYITRTNVYTLGDID